MKRLLLVPPAMLWCLVVFLFTFWATFPSDRLANRLRYEVPGLLGPEYSAEIDSVGLWWFGLSAKNIKIFRTHAGTDDAGEDLGPSLAAIARDARLAVRPWSLIRRAPYVSGSLTLTEGTIDYAVGTRQDGGDIALADLVIGAEAFPVGDLLMLAPGAPGAVDGTIDLALDLHAGSNGMRDATGSFSLEGKSLLLSDVEIPGVGALGMDIPISEISIGADVRAGKATLTRGLIQSTLLTLEISGDVTLRDPIDRSNVDVQFSLSNLGAELAPYEGFMADAKQSDGKYVFSCRGNISRLTVSSCSVGTKDRRSTTRPGSTPTTAGGRPIVSPRSAGTPETDEERERRREEIRERLRLKREEREGGAATEPEALPPEGGTEDIEELEEEPEQLEEDEPPPEDEDLEH